MGEEIPAQAHLDTARRYEHSPPAEIPEPTVQTCEKDPEEAGDDEDEGARNVCPLVAADVGTQGEELADGRPLKSEPGWG